VGELITLGIVVWIILGVIAASAIGDNSKDDRVTFMAFFWPITVPILLVFGIIWCIYYSIRTGISFFKEN